MEKSIDNRFGQLPKEMFLPKEGERDLYPWTDFVGNIYGEHGKAIFDTINGTGTDSYDTQASFEDALQRMDDEIIGKIVDKYQVTPREAGIIYQDGHTHAAAAISKVIETVLPQNLLDAYKPRNEAFGASRRPSDQFIRFKNPVDEKGNYEINRLQCLAHLFGMDVAAIRMKNDHMGQLMNLIDHTNMHLFDIRRGEVVSPVHDFFVIHRDSDNFPIQVIRAITDHETAKERSVSGTHIKKYSMAMRSVDGIRCAVDPSLKAPESAVVKAYGKVGGAAAIEDYARMMLIVDGGEPERDYVMDKLKYSLERSDLYGRPQDDDYNDGRGKGNGSVSWRRIKIREEAQGKGGTPIEIACLGLEDYCGYRYNIPDDRLSRKKAWPLFAFERTTDFFREIFPDRLYNPAGAPIDEAIEKKRQAIIYELRNSRVSEFIDMSGPRQLEFLDSMAGI